MVPSRGDRSKQLTHCAGSGAIGWRVTVHASTGDDIGMGRIDIAEDTPIPTGFANFTEYCGELLRAPNCRSHRRRFQT